MCLAKQLISYARHRQRCYELTGTYDGARAKAVSDIIRVASFYTGRKDGPWIRQIINQILLILPSAGSRYTRQREQILTLISNYGKLHQEHHEDGPRMVRHDTDQAPAGS